MKHGLIPPDPLIGRPLYDGDNKSVARTTTIRNILFLSPSFPSYVLSGKDRSAYGRLRLRQLSSPGRAFVHSRLALTPACLRPLAVFASSDQGTARLILFWIISCHPLHSRLLVCLGSCLPLCWHLISSRSFARDPSFVHSLIHPYIHSFANLSTRQQRLSQTAYSSIGSLLPQSTFAHYSIRYTTSRFFLLIYATTIQLRQFALATQDGNQSPRYLCPSKALQHG